VGSVEGASFAAPGEGAGDQLHHRAEIEAEPDNAQARAAGQAALDRGRVMLAEVSLGLGEDRQSSLLKECVPFTGRCTGGTVMHHLRNARRRTVPEPEMLDVSLHERRPASRMQDPEYRLAYDRAAREIAQTDSVIRELDALRVDLGMSKAELARRVNRNASSVRRLFTASQARPELPLIAAIADVLGADLRVVRRPA
jgi:hypothetical protein